MVDAHYQYRFVFGDLLCFPLQDHERLWKFDVKNDIGFYVGDEDSVKGGSVIYMPYNHSFLTPGNVHRVVISDIQLLQCYSKRCDIRRNPLPYSIVRNAVMNLLSNMKTPTAQKNTDYTRHRQGRRRRNPTNFSCPKTRCTNTCHPASPLARSPL